MLSHFGTPRSLLPSILALAALSSQGCGEGSDASSEPVPCRLRIDGPCDVFDEACQERLAGLASCLWSDSGSVLLPPINAVTREQFEASFAANVQDVDSERARVLQGWQWALSALGLTASNSFDPEEQASASRIVAYYRHHENDITLVQGSAGEPTSIESNQILVHELIHALQDADFDLERVSAETSGSFDAQLALRSLVEGEANLHEWRAQVILLGDEVGVVDYASGFRDYRESAESWLFTEGDPLRETWGVVPYTYGGYWAFDEWSQQDLTAQWASPPGNMLPILAKNWNLESGKPRQTWPDLELTADAQYVASDVMGAWGVYLALRSELGAPAIAVDEARKAAAAWRGDMLDLVSLADDSWALSWRIDFATSAAAEVFSQRMEELDLAVSVDEEHVTIVQEQMADPEHAWLGEAAE